MATIDSNERYRVLSIAAQTAGQSASVSLVGMVLTAIFSAWLVRLGRRNEKALPLIFVGVALFIGNCAVAWNALFNH